MWVVINGTRVNTDFVGTYGKDTRHAGPPPAPQKYLIILRLVGGTTIQVEFGEDEGGCDAAMNVLDTATGVGGD